MQQICKFSCKNVLFKRALLIMTAWSLCVFLVGTVLPGIFKISGLNENIDFFQLFFRNSLISLFLFFGVFSYGIISFLVSGINFLFFGMQIRAAVDKYSFLVVAKRIFSHAIFEVPSIIISSSFGLILLLHFFNYRQSVDWHRFFKNSFFIFTVVAFLNLAAALVETFVSSRWSL